MGQETSTQHVSTTLQSQKFMFVSNCVLYNCSDFIACKHDKSAAFDAN